jgi:hypothetical protein
MELLDTYYRDIKEQARQLAINDDFTIGLDVQSTLYIRKPLFSVCNTPPAKFAIPGVYRWTITGSTPYIGSDLGIYVGRFTSADRPLNRYAKNILDLFTNQLWHGSSREEFRLVHHVLANALLDKRTIELSVLDNPSRGRLGIREGELIKECKANLDQKALNSEAIKTVEAMLQRATEARWDNQGLQRPN